jgi:outer membrane lipoprotein SlyB
MRFFVATLLATASILAPVVGYAESADVEATVKRVDMKNLSITLDDGKSYQTAEDFDFTGLEAGVKVIVFYTEMDGRRVVNDLDIVS